MRPENLRQDRHPQAAGQAVTWYQRICDTCKAGKFRIAASTAMSAQIPACTAAAGSRYIILLDRSDGKYVSVKSALRARTPVSGNDAVCRLDRMSADIPSARYQVCCLSAWPVPVQKITSVCKIRWR